MQQRSWVATLTRALSWPSRILWAVAAATVLIMAIHVLADVIARNVTHRPLPATLEITSTWWMPLIIFAGLGAAQLTNEHIRVTLFLDGLRGGTRRVAEIVALLTALLVIGIATGFAFEGAIESTRIQEALLSVIAVPVWPIKWVAAIGLAVFMLQLVVSLIETITARSEDLARMDEAEEVMEQLEEEGVA
jgi:TRAP-type C4-dicarboxylate transport system permease small subunit